MIDLKKSIWISIRITNQIDDPDERTVREDFAKNGEHFHLFETMIACFVHFFFRQTLTRRLGSNDHSLNTLYVDRRIHRPDERNETTHVMRLKRVFILKMFLEIFIDIVVEAMANEREEYAQR